MARWRAVIMGLLVLIVTGCINQSTDKTSDGTSPYKVFTQSIQSENMQKYGIDIVSMLDEHFDAPDIALYLSAANITEIEYTLKKCNLSKEGAHSEDVIIKIDAGKSGPDNARSFYMTIIFAFVLNEEGQLETVFDERFTDSGTNFEIIDVTGDGRDEIILEKTTGRQTGAQELINILTWCPEQNNMSVIFDEKLRYYPLHPYSCQNTYQFVPAQSGGYDIILYSKIYYREDDILEEGSTRFVYNGSKYVVSGTYYDYQTRGEAIGKEAQ